mgnify:CR=1 FL=1
MSKVSKLTVNTSIMPTAETVRTIAVNGKINSKFFIIVTQAGTIKFYDWTTETFTSGHAPKNNLLVEMSSSYFQRDVIFPTGGGTGGTYVVKLITLDETKTVQGFSVISKNIEKASSDTTITFAPTSNDTSKYDTLPSITAVGTGSDVVNKNFTFTINTNTTDSGSFGFRPVHSQGITGLLESLNPGGVLNDIIYHQTTENVVTNPQGSGVASNEVIVADLTDINIGTRLYYHKTTTAPSSVTRVTEIDLDQKIITFDNAVAFEHGATMTFRAYGDKNISLATGLSFAVEINLTSAPVLVKTVRADAGVSEATDGVSTTISLNNTKGITGGSHITYTGLGVDQTSDNKVVSVNPDATGSDADGHIVVQLQQELTAGTDLTFNETFETLTFSGQAIFSSFPSSNKTINMDLDVILTAGTAS